MIKKAVETTDSQTVQGCAFMQYSLKCDTYKLLYKGLLSVTLEMVKRSKTHGRENTHSEIALQLLKSVPDTGWSRGPTLKLQLLYENSSQRQDMESFRHPYF
ncbi:hypothetical protein AMECASPLE_031833 [Ameca splendens]|uniref:Uncharacterized protein n=1 Tax=Ameca splendens TaxID=208324 RepID=A0ABV0ZRB2_9TELE